MSNHGCRDMPLAKDLLRSHTCRIFDTLIESYRKQIDVSLWEKEIADEAIQIAFAVWNNFTVLPIGDFSSEVLRRTIVQHLGRPLRPGPVQMALPKNPNANLPGVSESDRIWVTPTSPYAILPTDPPLLRMAKEVANAAPPPTVKEVEVPGLDSLIAQRRALLQAYIAKTGASLHKIYTASNSGIHKPEFYKWRDGTLPNSSSTTINFERFLRSQKPPIPRKSR
jgi:hypothetical protein